MALAILIAGCGADPIRPVPGTSSSNPSAPPSAEPSAAPIGPPPTAAFFLSFDAEPIESTDEVKHLEEIATQLSAAADGRVELTGSAVSTGDLTNDRSKALRRGEALRNWFIEHKVSGVRVVVKNPGPPCHPTTPDAAVKECQGVQVDVWLR